MYGQLGHHLTGVINGTLLEDDTLHWIYVSSLMYKWNQVVSDTANEAVKYSQW